MNSSFYLSKKGIVSLVLIVVSIFFSFLAVKNLDSAYSLADTIGDNHFLLVEHFISGMLIGISLVMGIVIAVITKSHRIMDIVMSSHIAFSALAILLPMLFHFTGLGHTQLLPGMVFTTLGAALLFYICYIPISRLDLV